MKIACIIPARMKSTRFPGKPLAPILGLPMVVRTFYRVAGFDWSDIYVATDSVEISKVCDSFKIPSIITSDKHLTGTDRVAEAVKSIDCDFVVNVQGDEPIIPYQNIQSILDSVENKESEVFNAYTKISRDESLNPNTIKVILNDEGKLLYMSRHPIPYNKRNLDSVWHKQVCVYAFSKDSLNWYAEQGISELEKNESIELLRFLNSSKFVPKMIEVEPGTIAVDVPEDVQKVEEALQHAGD